MKSWKGKKKKESGRRRLYVFIPFWRRECASSIRHGWRLRDPGGAVRLTGSSPGQPAVHLLSRLDRPAVTHSAVKPWAGGFEMWQHNQFPWFMITPERRARWATGQLKEESRRGMLTTDKSTAMYSSGVLLLRAVLLLFVRSPRINSNNVNLSCRETYYSTESPPERSQSSGAAGVQREELIQIQIQIHSSRLQSGPVFVPLWVVTWATGIEAFTLNTSQQMHCVCHEDQSGSQPFSILGLD